MRNGEYKKKVKNEDNLHSSLIGFKYPVSCGYPLEWRSC